MVNIKIYRRIAALLLSCLILSGCGKESETQTAASEERKLRRRCEEIVSMYRDIYDASSKQEPDSRWDEPVLPQQSIDAIEERLMGQGLDVMDSSEDCPEYLANGEHFVQFWEAVQRGEEATEEIIFIRPTGALNYRKFIHQNGVTDLYSMVTSLDGTEDPDCEVHRIYGASLTERGNFYYRINPEDDPHYANYALIRLKKPDEELWGLYSRYVMAGGYTASNIYLTDWTEADFSTLCFNDLWEYLYRYQTGTQFWPDGYPYDAERGCYWIPASKFEPTVLPYFSLSADQLRLLAGYDSELDSYPWRQIESNDYVFYLSYYTIEPEVTGFKNNTDGTLSMTVELLSTDLGVDCLFSHELTVRPLEDDSFQFVGNKMLTQTEYGLPFCEPRLTWELAG